MDTQNTNQSQDKVTPEIQQLLQREDTKDISPLILLLGVGLVITIIVFIQQIIHDIQTAISSNFIAYISEDVSKLIASAVVTIPLFILSLLLFVYYRKRPLHDAYRLASRIALIAMIINMLTTVSQFFTVLYDVNTAIATYLVCIALIAAFTFGIIKLQARISTNTNKQKEQ